LTLEMLIRPAAPSDLATIAEFNTLMAWETEQRRLAPECIRAGVAALLADRAKGMYFVAESVEEPGPVVAGQLLITYEWSDWRNGSFWWIQSVYVAEQYRQKGIFRGLFQHVYDLARAEAGVCGLRLYMHHSNARARQAYERLNMQQTHYELFEIDFS